MIPLTLTANAANASMPSITVTSGNPVMGGTPTTITFTLKDPSSNQYALTGFVITAPSGWTITGCAGGVFLAGCVSSASAASFSVGGGAALTPGSSDSLQFDVTPLTGAYPFSGAFSSTVQDASSAAYYGGPTFNLQVMDPSSVVHVTLSPTGLTYTAGDTAYTVSAAVTCTTSSTCATGYEVGLPVVWSAPGYPSGTTYSFTPASANTGASGTTSTTFQPSNTAGDASTVVATIGTSAVSAATGSIGTVPGTPTKAAFLLAAAAFPAVHYVTTHGLPTGATGNDWAEIASGNLAVSEADAFGNIVPLSSVTGITVTALSGGGVWGATTVTSITCTSGVSCTTGAISVNYFQSGIYSTIGTLSVTVTRAAGSLSGASGQIVTSTFAVASPVPGVSTPPGTTATNVKAGGTVPVWARLGVVQQGVPVYLSLDAATSYETTSGASDYGANSLKAVGFGAAGNAVLLYSNSTGYVQSAYTVDTVASPTAAVAFFNANVTAPTDAVPTQVFANSADSVSATTIPGSIGSFTVLPYFYAVTPVPVAFSGATTHSVPGGTIYVNIALADAYGNPVTLATNANTLQINLVASSGLLSVTSVYITASHGSTGDSFGAIVWTMGSATGAATLTASGVVSGKQIVSHATVTVVSTTPTLFVNSPVATSGVVYTKSTHPVFGGNASISLGYPATGTAADSVISVCWTSDAGTTSAANGCAVIVSGASVTWTSVLSLAVGLHSVVFNATDANGNTATSAKYSVLVDNTNPTITFTTAANAKLNYSQPVVATVVVAEGDLNATSVTATANGTAIAASNIAISGVNSLGKSVTYTVSLKNLPVGTWNIALFASSLAGGSASKTIIVTVLVSYSNSVILSGATKATIGGYTGVSVSASNIWSTSQNLVIFAVWKNSAGQTVAVATGGLTLASGASGTAFAPLSSPLPSGTYTVSVFAVTTSNNPVSASTTLSVTL